MNRTALCLFILGTVLTGLSQPGSAQIRNSPPYSSNVNPPYAHPIGIHDRAKPDAITDRRATPYAATSPSVAAAADDEVDGGPNAFRYIAGGALVGAVATGVGLAIALSETDGECICAIQYLVVGGAALGAGVGGVLGLLIYAWRKETWVSHPF